MVDVVSQGQQLAHKALTNYQNKDRKESLFMMISSLTAPDKTTSIALKLENFKHLKIAPPSLQANYTEMKALQKAKEVIQLPPCAKKGKEENQNTSKRATQSLIISKPTNKQTKMVYGFQKRPINKKGVFKISENSLGQALEFNANDFLPDKSNAKIWQTSQQNCRVKSLQLVQSLQQINNANQDVSEEKAKIISTQIHATSLSRKDGSLQVKQSRRAQKGENPEMNESETQTVTKTPNVAKRWSLNKIPEGKMTCDKDDSNYLACVVWDPELKPKKHLPPLKITKFQSPDEVERLLPFRCNKNGTQSKAITLHPGYQSNDGNSHPGVEWISMFKSKGFRPGSSRSFPTKGELELMKSRDWVEDNPLCYAAKYAKYIGVESRDTKSRDVLKYTNRCNSI